MTDESVEVALGQSTYTVLPQPHPRITRTLPALLIEHQAQLNTSDLPGFVASLGDGTHAVLKVFIPELMPAWEFAGYPSQAAYEAGEDDPEAHALAPSLPQILAAFDAAFSVNGGQRLTDVLGKGMGSALTPELRALALKGLADLLSARLKKLRMPSGGSASPSSGTTARTSPSPRAKSSRSDGSSTSPKTADAESAKTSAS